MPVVTLTCSPLSDEVKTSVIEKLTAVVCEETGAPAQFVTVIIEEQSDTNLGVGGETVRDLKARLMAEKNA